MSTLVIVLLCIYIVQLIVSSRAPIREFQLKAADADAITQLTLVSAANGTVTLDLQQVPLQTALDILSASQGITYM